jgi:CRISPR-associated protein Csb3
MARSTIDVDLFNPGQVFACLGIAELAEALIGEAEAAFTWADDHTRFTVGVPGDRNPLAEACAFLAGARVSSIAPARSAHRTEKWEVPTVELDRSAPFPIPLPDSPATLPAVLEAATGPRLIRVIVDYWGDTRAGRDPVKFWGGAGGKPGAAVAQDALDLVRDRLRETGVNPLSLAAPQSGSFRLDWRRDYIPIDIGFSLNEHKRIVSRGFPAVEMLAAIGLTHARPRREHKLEYRYGVLGALDELLFPLSMLRAALGMAPLPFPTRTFRIDLGWPGQKDKERSITTVTEETA